MNLKWRCPVKVQMMPFINFSFLSPIFTFYAAILLCEIKHTAIAI